MKVTLKRKIYLYTAYVYLKLQKKVLRNDIREYLNGNLTFSNDIVTKKIDQYLSDLKILNQGKLTEKGNEILKSGLISEPEEGKYKIWYTKNDPMFGSKIFYLTRAKPEKYNNELKNFDTTFINISKFLSIDGVPDYECDFLINKIADYYEETREEKIICKWILLWNNELKKIETKIYFEGMILIDNEPAKINEKKEYLYDIDISQFPEILPDWNEKTGRRRFKLNEKIDYNYFEYSGENPCKNFESCSYDKLRVEPYNEDEAIEWRNNIINLELKEGYVHPDDFIDSVISSNQKDGFSAYKQHLDNNIPDLNEYLSKLDSNIKIDRSPDYWHLAAPMDLNISIPKSLYENEDAYFCLKENENKKLTEIADEFIRLNKEKTYEKIIYYDKYVINYYQQRTVLNLLKCFDASKKYIITNTISKDYDEYLTKEKKDITVEDIGKIFKKKKNIPHDRYVIFKNGNNIEVWTSTNSLSFIRFNKNGEIDPVRDTGKVYYGVTFTKIKFEMLGNDIKGYILSN